MIKVSIIIPIYNVEQYLKECLDSTINQTLKDIEIICVNDCTPDDSMTIVKEYAKKDSRIKIINKEKNDGLGVTRNIGLENATGKYVLFLDSDDYIALDCCEKLYKKIESDNVDAIYFNVHRFVDGRNKGAKYRNLKTLANENKAYVPFNAQDKYRTLVNFSREACFIFYSRKFLVNNKLLFSKHRICEDSLFRLNFLISNPKISIFDEELYYYRKRKGSLITQSEKKLNDFFNITEKYFEIVINSTITKDDQLAFIKNQISWLSSWTNKKSYNKQLLLFARKKRKELYLKILNTYSYNDIINSSFDQLFWRDLTEKNYKFIRIYSYYKRGAVKYRIRIPFSKKL